MVPSFHSLHNIPVLPPDPELMELLKEGEKGRGLLTTVVLTYRWSLRPKHHNRIRFLLYESIIHRPEKVPSFHSLHNIPEIWN